MFLAKEAERAKDEMGDDFDHVKRDTASSLDASHTHRPHESFSMLELSNPKLSAAQAEAVRLRNRHIERGNQLLAVQSSISGITVESASSHLVPVSSVELDKPIDAPEGTYTVRRYEIQGSCLGLRFLVVFFVLEENGGVDEEKAPRILRLDIKVDGCVKSQVSSLIKIAQDTMDVGMFMRGFAEFAELASSRSRLFERLQSDRRFGSMVSMVYGVGPGATQFLFRGNVSFRFVWNMWFDERGVARVDVSAHRMNGDAVAFGENARVLFSTRGLEHGLLALFEACKGKE